MGKNGKVMCEHLTSSVLEMRVRTTNCHRGVALQRYGILGSAVADVGGSHPEEFSVGQEVAR